MCIVGKITCIIKFKESFFIICWKLRNARNATPQPILLYCPVIAEETSLLLHKTKLRNPAFSLLQKRSVSTLFKKDIALCCDLTNSKSLQLFVGCQGEWVVSGRQPAERLNTGLCCFDGGRGRIQWSEGGEKLPPTTAPTSTLSYPHPGECFRRQRSHVRIESQTEEQKREGAEEWRGISYQCWVGCASTPSLRCNTGNEEEEVGLWRRGEKIKK